jgi:hypothetical protein
MNPNLAEVGKPTRWPPGQSGKASAVNDENLLTIEENGALASQYAIKIMEIYNPYQGGIIT